MKKENEAENQVFETKEQSVHSNNQKSSKVLLYSCVVLLCALLIGLAYTLGRQSMKQTPIPLPAASPIVQVSPKDEMERWKTYTSLKEGYTFKYPLEARAQEADDESPFSIAGPDDKFYYISFRLTENRDKKPLKEFIEDVSYIKNGSIQIPGFDEIYHYTISKFEKIEIDGKEAYHLKAQETGEIDSPGLIDQVYIYYSDNQVLLIDNGHGENSSTISGSVVFDQILSTFRFVDQ